MISDSINIQAVTIEFVLIICSIFAFELVEEAASGDSEWTKHFDLQIHNKVPDKLQYADSRFKKIFGSENTIYLLERSMVYEKIVLVFLLIFAVACIIHFLFCLISKEIGKNKLFYEVFFTFGFFMQTIFIAMYFLSVHTYIVNIEEWEVRNQDVFIYRSNNGEVVRKIIGKTHHPCSSESQEQLSQTILKQMEKSMGPFACQLYETKFTALVLMTIGCICSLWIIIFVSNCCSVRRRKVVPLNVTIATTDVQERTEQTQEYKLPEETVSISTVETSTQSSTVVIICEDDQRLLDDNSNDINPETILSKFRSELAVIHVDK